MKLEIFNSKRKTLNFIDRYYRKLIKENPEKRFEILQKKVEMKKALKKDGLVWANHITHI